MDPKEKLEEMALERLDSPEPSNRDLADALKVIINRLWTKDDLRNFVSQEHQAMCANCDKAKKHGLTLWDKWAMGLVGTLVTALCGALYYFTKVGGS